MTLDEEIYAVARKNLKDFKDPSRGKYLNMLLTNSKGTIVANVWDQGEKVAAQIAEGDVIKVVAEEDSYRGTPQLNIQRIEVLDSDEYSSQEFIRVVRDPLALLSEIELYVEDLKYANQNAYRLVADLFHHPGDLIDDFVEQTGAQYYHHAGIGGLAQHSLEVARLAGQFCEGIDALVRDDEIDRDLVLAGALLHDIGKIKSYILKGSIVTTEAEERLGHIAIGLQMVMSYVDPDNPLKPHLEHIIASHHGKQEWGSPKEPETIEAYIIHQADAASSQLTRLVEVGG